MERRDLNGDPNEDPNESVKFIQGRGEVDIIFAKGGRFTFKDKLFLMKDGNFI
jgi:hypothetical protein